MRRASFLAVLLGLLVSLFLLSILSNVLTGYTGFPREERKRQTGGGTWRYTEEEPSVLLFKVSPATPRLYWSVSTADYYTGFNWLRTTEEKLLREFPRFQAANATREFHVEVVTSQREVLLPIPSPNSTLADISLAPTEDLRLYMDAVGNVFKAIRHGQAGEVPLVYNVSWRYIEIDDKLISLDDVPEEILNKYLQLPDLPIEVWKFAQDLEDPSYDILDQVLADVEFLRTNFVYDADNSRYLYERIPQGSDVFSYITRRRGVCIDAATALAVVLRIQKIPARISIGYKPAGAREGKLLYYTTGAHALTEAYLPPYGWVQFDATPQLEESPLIRMSPFKKEASPGSRLFYQLYITNRQNATETFRLFVSSKQNWKIETFPEELEIEALQTAEALLLVTIPDDVKFGEKDMVTLTAVSLNNPSISFSILIIIEAENIYRVSTTTTLSNIDEAVIRGDTFWVNGTVLAASGERVDNMTVSIFLTKGRESEGKIVGTGYSKQGNFQIEILIPHFTEIGEYKMITISLGTTQYAPSSTDSILRVRATTRMELGSEEDFLLGYGAIHGRLLWDNGTGFADAPVSLEVTSLATPSQAWKLQNLTFADGSFRMETAFKNSGVYEVEAVFSGSDYALGSNATRIVKMKRELPAIQILCKDTTIRGEAFNITGTVQYKNIGIWGQPLTMTFDNRLLAVIETGENGSFTSSFLVDSEERLGPHYLMIALKEGNVSTVHEVAVKSKTRLITDVSNVAGGTLLLFSASISDDHDMPIQGAEVVVDNYGLSWKTDKNGNLTFLLDTVKLWPANLKLTARFEGSEHYLPVTTEKEVVFEAVISLPFLISLVFPALVIMALVYAKRYTVKRQALRQTRNLAVVTETMVVEEEPIYRPQEVQPLKILLPDMDPRFPNVWGVRDKLRIEVVLDKSFLGKVKNRNIEVLIDEEIVASVSLSPQGKAEFSYVFHNKGEHKIRAILSKTSRHQPWIAEIELRVVDYEEEIIRLYNEFLGKLGSHGILARNEMTARELESLILRKSDFGPEALRRLTVCFEKAEYSDHLATRRDYEIMYLTLKELNVDFE